MSKFSNLLVYMTSKKKRTITLMNTEFQMNKKKMGREFMKCAEAAQAVTSEQNGSRQFHHAVFAALNKRLTMDLLRLRRHTGALSSQDLLSCYDRVCHLVVYLSMRRLGAPHNALKSMFSTLWHASHCIRTAYGTSEATFGGPDRFSTSARIRSRKWLCTNRVGSN